MTRALRGYIRPEIEHTPFCPGCGHGSLMGTILRAIEDLGWDMDEMLFVSGIGCAGWIPSPHFNADTLHTLHGRAVAFATGAKLFNPALKVMVIGGDGDLTSIGGNHLIHAARRNIDLTLIIINNFIYGLTNSQTSPTTPRGFWTVSQKVGNIDPTFNGCKLAEAAGASFVAREKVSEPRKLEKVLQKALAHKGFSYVEVLSNCHINLGRKNKMANAMENLDWIDSITMPKKKYDALSDEEKINYLPTGILKEDTEAEEYCDMYKEVQKAQQGLRPKITPDDFKKKI